MNIENKEPNYGFTEEKIRQLKDENDNIFNPEMTLKNICTQVFRSEKIRELSELMDSEDEHKNNRALDIQRDIIELCSKIVTVATPKKIRRLHEKGEDKLDEQGNKIKIGTDNAGLPIYDTWDSKGVEVIETFEETPFWNPKSDFSRERLKKQILSQRVQPDIDLIKERLCPEDINESYDIIKKITKYYTFEDPELFVKGFFVLASNAKSKALNRHPAWPIMLTIVGKQGQGKGWLRDMITNTYDEVFETKSEPATFKSVLGSDFNAILRTRGFLAFDEKNGLNGEEVESLKSFITEPRILVNQKHKDARSFDNLTTFIAVANETIKSVMQWQRDRRIVECTLIGKTGEYPADELRKDLIRLWRIIPVVSPFDVEVKDRLIAESQEILDTKMIEIVNYLFTEHSREFITNGKYINKWKFENLLKGMKGVKVQSVVDWCIEKGIVNKYSNGSYVKSAKGVDWLMNEYENLIHKFDDPKNDDIENQPTGTLKDIEELFSKEGL